MNVVTALGAAYVLMFVFVAARWPQVALAMIFGSAPFQQELPLGLPISLSLAEVNLTLTLAVFFLQRVGSGQTISFGPLTIPITLYLGVCVLSCVGTFRGNTTIVAFSQMLVYLIFAPLVFSSFARGLRDYQLALYTVIVVDLFLAFCTLASGTGYVLGLHKNGIGESLCCGVLIAVELWYVSKDIKLRNLLLVATGILSMGLIMTLSRGSWLGTIVGLSVSSVLRKRYRFMLQACVVLVPFIICCWLYLPSESREFATGFESTRENIGARYKSVDYAMDKFNDSPVLGVGVGLRKEFDATNIVMMVLAETGIAGLLTFALIHVSLIRLVYVAQRNFAPGEFGFSILGIGVALLFAKLGHGLVDHYWSRGSITLAWGGAGMVTRVYYLAQGREESVMRDRLMKRRERLTAAPSNESASAIPRRSFPGVL